MAKAKELAAGRSYRARLEIREAQCLGAWKAAWLEMVALRMEFWRLRERLDRAERRQRRLARAHGKMLALRAKQG